MYCPQCRSEFRPGFDWCSDCEMALVEALDPLPTKPLPPRLVPVFKSGNCADVAIVSAFLTGAEIEHFVRNSFLSTWHPAMGPADVLVREDELREAVEVLQELDPRFTQDWEGRLPERDQPEPSPRTRPQ